MIGHVLPPEQFLGTKGTKAEMPNDECLTRTADGSESPQLIANSEQLQLTAQACQRTG